MKNSTVLVLMGIMLIGTGIFVFAGNKSPQANGNVIGTGDVQKVTLSQKNYNYFPQTITVKAGQPVELTLDSKVQGCYRSFTIRELGVAGYARTPQEKITFTVPKPGTYKFSCSMGMGSGTLQAV